MGNVISLDPTKRVSKSFLAVINYTLIDGRETTTSVSLEAASTGAAIKCLMQMGVLEGKQGITESVSFYMTNVSEYVRLGRLPAAALTMDRLDLEMYFTHHLTPAKIHNI